MTSGQQNYLLDNRASQAAQRFVALSALFDEVTLRHLRHVGLKAGWHCWEVGAGGPGVPSAIADIVGPVGSVLATDIDTTWLPDGRPGDVPDGPPDGWPGSVPDRPPGGQPGGIPDGQPGDVPDEMPARIPSGISGGIPEGMPDGTRAARRATDAAGAQETAIATRRRILRVARHDIEHDDIPPEPFDLVHARLVLVHLKTRDAVLQKLVRALKPGGWLVIEDADPNLQPLACLEERGEHQRAQKLVNRIRRGFRQLMAERGVDLGYGRTLPGRLREAGLRAVGADVFFPLCRDETRALEIATIDMLREPLIAGGLASRADIAECVENLARLPLDIATAPLVSAWGQKPA